jgi:hypothetical protein
VKVVHYYLCFLCVTDPDAIPTKTEVKLPYLGDPVAPELRAYKYSPNPCVEESLSDATDERRPLLSLKTLPEAPKPFPFY